MPNENEAFQHGGDAQTGAQRQPLGTFAETPVPSTRPVLEDTPDDPVLRQPRRAEGCVDELCQGAERLSLEDQATTLAIPCQGTEDKATPEVALRPRTPSSPAAAPGCICRAALQHSSAGKAPSIASEMPPAKRVRGLGELPQTDLWAGKEMPVKNTFIDFDSPRERTPTTQLTGNSAPDPRGRPGRSFARRTFMCTEEPAARPIAAPEPPRVLRLEEYLPPMPARTAAAAAAGETVVRQLFQHASDPF